ncbi:MAG TPA: ATP-binding protein [Leptolyngbyaceae cyanobacterium]
MSDITKRQQTEKALKRYQLLSEYSRDIVLYINKDGQILEANQAAVQAYGYDHTELLTLKIADLRAPDTHSNLPQQFNQASEQGILFETVHVRKDGSPFPVEVSAQSAVIDDETVVLSVIRDITERKKAELEREQLLAREQAAREAAEATERRARFLAEVGTTLTSSLDYEFTLKSVAQAVVPTLADWCAVDILKDDGTLERLATAHIDPAKVQWGIELHRRYPPNLNASQGIAQVLRTGQAECYPVVSDEQLVAAARDAEHLRVLREVGLRSVMLVPLSARGRTLGVITFIAAESGRLYNSDDLSLAEELARRAAIALDNARLYQEAQAARQAAERAVDRTARLQAVTAALSESLTPAQVAEVIVEQSIAALEADAALIALLSEDGSTLEVIRSVGYGVSAEASKWRFPLDSSLPLSETVRTGQPAWSEPLAERLRRYPHLAETYKRFPFEAWISLPLVVEGKAVGGLSLSFNKFKHLNQEDRDFVLALTQQCAQAIVRAQLYAAEQKARADAEHANRIKDEFLAILSHELRSPLNPILGWIRLLQTQQLDQATTERAMATIERNAKLQAQLVEDLLDMSRILRGKLTLTVAPVSLESTVYAALETVQLAAEAKMLQIQTNIVPPVPQILGDANRLQQVVWNLLSNAVKFTPAGGQVEVTLETLNAHAQITVSDTGAGIKPNFLPHVFESFRQADGGTTRQFGGLGLGLAIVRQLVEAHGGSIKADSPGEGLGATFTVQLPLLSTEPEIGQSDGPQQGELDLTGICVLVVDDEPDAREFLTVLLRQYGAEVLTVASAAEVLSALESSQPDVLVSDVGMPEVDGYTLIRQIRALPPEKGGQIPAIALTAYAREEDQQQALASGFQQHLSKPVDLDQLISSVWKLSKSHQSLNLSGTNNSNLV